MNLDIIIPCFYPSEIIYPCLNSIKNQTVINNITVIMVNDCSTNTECEYMDLRNEFSKYFKIKYLKTDYNSGPGIARQLGLDNATDEWVMFIDDDDELYDNTSVERLIKQINSDNIVSVSGQSIHVNLVTGQQISLQPWIHHQGSIYNRTILKECNIRYDPRLSFLDEDTCFSHMILLYTKQYKQIQLAEPIYKKKCNNQKICSLTSNNLIEKTLLHTIGLYTNVLDYYIHINCEKEFYNDAYVGIANLLLFLSTFPKINFTQQQCYNLLSFLVQFNNSINKCNLPLSEKECENSINFIKQKPYFKGTNFIVTYDNVLRYKQENLIWIKNILEKVTNE